MRRELEALAAPISGGCIATLAARSPATASRKPASPACWAWSSGCLPSSLKDKNKLYSLHAPEVVCIAKGKAHKRYEFGCKVGMAATNREGLFLAAKAFEDNPYDGHTLQATLDQAETMTGVKVARAYADKGYKGHDYEGPDHGSCSPDAKTRPDAPL